MTNNSMVDTIVEALTTDGGHHKQWYLEEILKTIVGNEEFSKLKKHLEWEGGIPP